MEDAGQHGDCRLEAPHWAEEPSLPAAVRLAMAGSVFAAAATVEAQGRLNPLEARRYLNRAAFGPTAESMADIMAIGVQPWVDVQLQPHLIPETLELTTRLSALTTLSMAPATLFSVSAGQVINELTDATFLRAVYSRRQLFERMVEFWTDHFNIDVGKTECRFLKTVDDRDVIRKHAMGKLEDLLMASAKSPAMLTYLDNRMNVKDGPNQNYAREFLELHTVGLGNFTQTDVIEVARCFTGWSVTESNAGSERGKFIFNPARHDNGAKRVLGVDIPAGGGIQDGETVVKIVANHAATQARLVRKLCEFFHGPNPSSSLLKTAQRVMLTSRGELKPVIRAVLDPNHMRKANAKVRRPFSLFAGMIRAVNPTVVTLGGTREHLAGAGHLPFRWSPPDGYPHSSRYWSGNMLPRWSFAFKLAGNGLAGVQVPANLLLGDASNLTAVIDRINAQLFGGIMSTALRSALIGYGSQGAFSEALGRDLYGLAMASPEFQFG